MATATATKKPRVVGIVILCILVGALSLLGAVFLLVSISALEADPTLGGSIQTDPATVATVIALKPFAYLGLVLGVLDLIAAILLLMYKKAGLYLAAISFGLTLLQSAYSQITGNGGITTIINIVLDLLVLYYVYIYLTREPEKTFFT
jgi:hypothetical protein